MFLSVSIILVFCIKCVHRTIKNRKESIFTTMKKHDENVLTLCRQFEKLKLKQCRVEQAIEFLRMRLLYNISPKGRGSIRLQIGPRQICSYSLIECFLRMQNNFFLTKLIRKMPKFRLHLIVRDRIFMRSSL